MSPRQDNFIANVRFVNSSGAIGYNSVSGNRATIGLDKTIYNSDFNQAKSQARAPGNAAYQDIIQGILAHEYYEALAIVIGDLRRSLGFTRSNLSQQNLQTYPPQARSRIKQQYLADIANITRTMNTLDPGNNMRSWLTSLERNDPNVTAHITALVTQLDNFHNLNLSTAARQTMLQQARDPQMGLPGWARARSDIQNLMTQISQQISSGQPGP